MADLYLPAVSTSFLSIASATRSQTFRDSQGDWAEMGDTTVCVGLFTLAFQKGTFFCARCRMEVYVDSPVH